MRALSVCGHAGDRMVSRSVVFVCFVIIFLCGPAMLACASGLLGEDRLPDQLSSRDAAYLAGGSVEADIAGNATVGGIVEGRLQEAIEAGIGNSIPMKAAALLGSAKIQRSAIEASNALFAWEAYPTYYGSKHAYVPHLGAIAALPREVSEWSLGQIELFSTKLRVFAAEHPEKRFAVCLVDFPSNSQANPLRPLVSEYVSNGDIFRILEDLQAGEMPANMDVIHVGYEDPDALYEAYFKTDSHWNTVGAREAFNKIAESFGLQACAPSPLSDQANGTQMSYGVFARDALMLLGEDVAMTEGALPSPQLHVSNGAWVSGEPELSDDEKRNMFAFYETYYGGGKVGAYDRIKGSGSKEALMVSDSFGLAICRFVGSRYSDLRMSTALYGAQESSEKLEDLIEDIDDVLFVGTYANYASFLMRNPAFF